MNMAVIPIWKPSLLFRAEKDLAQCGVAMQGGARGKRASGRADPLLEQWRLGQ